MRLTDARLRRRKTSRADRNSLHPDEIERFCGATLRLKAKLNRFPDARHKFI
jgi:hypothetical protein